MERVNRLLGCQNCLVILSLRHTRTILSSERETFPHLRTVCLSCSSWLQGQILILPWSVVMWETSNLGPGHSSLLHVGWHSAVSSFHMPGMLMGTPSPACLSVLYPAYSPSWSLPASLCSQLSKMFRLSML